jgi:hypothetical protein
MSLTCNHCKNKLNVYRSIAITNPYIFFDAKCLNCKTNYILIVETIMEYNYGAL